MYDILFQKGKIGNVELKNRLVMSPMGSNLAELDGSCGDAMIAYYEDVNKARRGMTALAELIEEDCSIRAWLTDSGR